MLRIENITLKLGNQLLFRHFNMQVNAGEMVCLTGESGCGKTSLLKVVLGFLPLSEGQIYVDNEKLTIETVQQIRQKIAYVPQELFLPCEWVSEMVQLPFELKSNRDVKFSSERLFRYWEKLGLDADSYHKRVAKISGGQRQRMMLAVSGMLRRKLLLIDEPTSALDGESMNKVMDFFQELKQEGCALLAVSHDTRFSQGCDRTINL